MSLALDYSLCVLPLGSDEVGVGREEGMEWGASKVLYFAPFD